MTKNVDTIYYVTPLQHGMLHHSQQDRRSGVYVEQFSCVLRGPLDAARFRAAWEVVVQRHDVLKTLFIRLNDEKPMQVVRKQVALPFRQEDWRSVADDEQQRRFEALLAEDRAEGFDPAVAPLMRVRLIDLGNARHRFLWTYHHAILDGWSMPILLDEVFRLYAAGPTGPAALRPKASDYRHHVAWLRAQDAAQARAFWTELLKGYKRPVGFAASTAPAPAAPAGAARRLASVAGALPSAWADDAAKLCRAQRITLNTLCQGAWSLLLGLYADSDDVVHGMVVSGRSTPLSGIDAMVGLFINTLPARATLDGGLPAMEWLRRLQSTTQQAERFAYTPLSEVLQCSELPRQQALFDSLYVFENYPGQSSFRALVAANGLEVEDIRVVEETNYALALIVLPVDGLQFQLTYDTARFGEAAMARMVEQYRGLLLQLVAAGEARLDELRLQAAHAPVRADEAATCASDESLLALLARHAAAAPDRPAHVGAVHSVDYRTLADRLEQAVSHWHHLGWRPGDRVLLCCDDDVPGLVMLLSGLACGIECVLPEHGLSVDALLAAGPSALGAYRVQACLGTRPRLAPPEGVRWEVFEPLDLASQRRAEGVADETLGVQQPQRGACLLVGLRADGDWTLMRYEHAQLLHAAAWFARRYPVRAARDVPLAGSTLRHTNLWTALLALSNGLTLRPLAGDDFPRELAASGRHWHSVRFDAEQTRRLAHGGDADIRTDHWVADASTLSAAGIERLRRTDAQACLVHELRWPAQSLPHAAGSAAAAPADELGTPVPGAELTVVDRNLRPAARDALGVLTVAGPTVPTALLHNGAPARDAWLAAAGGPTLLTGLRAWHGDGACRADLPQATAPLGWAPSARQLALEQAIVAASLAQDVAVVDRLSAQREWQHAVFYRAAQAAPPDAASRIQALCDAHGFADATLTEVAAWPTGPRGADRLALVRGDVRAVVRSAHVAPRDELESALHTIWCTLLKRERISVDDDYFDLGGQSLLASVMLYQIEEQLAAAVDMETLLERPTIAGIAQAIRAGNDKLPRERRDLSQDAVLAADIVPAGDFTPAPPQRIFLTGATGFLGVHLLAELLEKTQAQVLCLVRAADETAGHRRLAEAMKAHGLWRPRHETRIVAVPGELDKPSFGLPAERFSALAAEVDLIYHNGAMVNFVYPYASLKQVNVLATEDVLRLACLHRLKPVHYISTVGVLDRTAESIPEALAIPLHDFLVGGYEQSKWVAEQLMVLAARRGVPVTIYRPSRIVGHSKTGHMNTDDLFCRLIKGIVLFGKAPRNTGFDNMLPVDVVGRIIVEASLAPSVQGKAVHVVNPSWHTLDAVVDFIEADGHAIERLDYDAWLEQLTAHVKREREHPLAMLIPVLRKLNPVEDPSVGRRLPIVHDHLLRFAGAAVAEADRPVQAWLRVYFDRFYASGYLPRPARTAGRPVAAGDFVLP
jgi:myxalamid-type nonribosomal peptide synthetase MxaA